MHGSSLARMKWFERAHLAGADHILKVLDIGSCEVAGGSYRQFFPPERYEYTGLDMQAGPNVDIVPEVPYCWPEIEDDAFDVVISGQAFEHMEFFWLTAAEMARVLKPLGLMCIVAPRGFERHRYPVDCYRFDADGMAAIARWCGLEILHASCDMQPPHTGEEWHIENCEDAMLVACKPQGWSGILNPARYKFAEPGNLSGEFEPCRRLAPAEERFKSELARARDETEAAKKEAEALREEMARMREAYELRLSVYENSRSWRITAPLRALRKAAQRIAQKRE